ncbi:ABC transporter G family member 9-like isoform X2 [Glycine soja]|uniref:ABC transporter G family member 9 isoform B n=1 Tax=Glycine soja TaxID=3848 RepID=A0A445I6Q3_GLYSO|nr:ABC transporter G family member 9-like isoform X2 [Glycine soja]RZB81662.1 ABC transporter G family member 9 isoform B [Glycine soja]
MSEEMASERFYSVSQRLQSDEAKQDIYLKVNKPLTLRFEDVVHKIKISKGKGLLCYNKEVSSEETLVLKGISGVIFPGELLVILGPSGCGKTTLLAALGGRLNHSITRGSITYNGKPLSKSVKQNLGFVSQQDVFYPHLSVSETLIFSALLRLPNSVSKEEKILKAQAIMNELDLTHCKDTIMGGPLLRGVSGGEWKRVSIGQQLLTNPSLLLVDEPTSGLDSTTARRIVLTLCELAKDGRTVIMTIHQPSSKLFYMFQKILLLSDGRSLYFGKGENVMNYFSSIGYTPSVAMNPTDFLLDLANGIYSENLEEDTNATKQVLLSAFESNLASQVKMELQISRDSIHHNSEDEIFGQHCTTWWQQFTILLRRGFKERKYEQFSPHKICHVFVLSFFAGSLWWQSGADQMHDQLALPTLLVTVTYWMGGLKAKASIFFRTLAVALLYSLVSQGFGLAIGALLINNQKVAITVGTVVMTLFLLVNGFFVRNTPAFVSWIKYLSHGYYSYKLLLGSQFNGYDTYHCGQNVTCSAVNYPTIKHVGIDKQGLSVAALVAMLVGYRLIAYFALRIGTKLN